MLLSTTPSIACTRTRTITVEVPRVVMIDRCEIVASPLPIRPVPADPAACHAAFGDGAKCYDKPNAWRLAALLEALGETWLAVKACEEAQP